MKNYTIKEIGEMYLYDLETNRRIFPIETSRDVSHTTGVLDTNYVKQGDFKHQIIESEQVDWSKSTMVVSAIIVNEYGEVLLGKRSEGQKHAGYWEFPGGKVDHWETEETAIKRELKEELNVTFEFKEWFDWQEYQFGDGTLIGMRVALGSTQDTPNLIVHEELRWVSLDDILSMNIIPSNVGVVRRLVRLVDKMNYMYKVNDDERGRDKDE